MAGCFGIQPHWLKYVEVFIAESKLIPEAFHSIFHFSYLLDLGFSYLPYLFINKRGCDFPGRSWD